jgi:hypothetical protein
MKVYSPPKHVVPIIKFKWKIAMFLKAHNPCHHYFEKWIKNETFTNGIWKEVPINIVTSEINN